MKTVSILTQTVVRVCMLYCEFPLVPSGTPRDFAVVSITSTSAVLSWNPPSVDEQNGIITGYVINVTLLATGESYLLSSNTTTLLVDILRPFRKYLCIVAAETGIGAGPFGTQIEVQTPQDGETKLITLAECHNFSTVSILMYYWSLYNSH